MPPHPPFLDDLDRDPEKAWKLFVDAHTDLIVAILANYLPDPDLKMDAYVFVMEGFRADNFRRFEKYRERARTGDAPFIAWLKFVTRNLALDFLRHHKGRRSLPKVVEEMNAAGQTLFRCLYWSRMSYAEACEEMRARHDSAIGVGEIARRAHALAAARADSGHPRGWGAPRGAVHHVSFDDPNAPFALEADATEGAAAAGFTAPESPDAAHDRDLAQKETERLLSILSEDERLLLKLRYEDRLSAEEVARIVGAPTAKAVYNRIARIVERLRAHAADRKVG